MYDVIRITVIDPKTAIRNPATFAEYSVQLEAAMKALFGDIAFAHEVADGVALHDSITADFSGISTGKYDAVVLGHAQTIRQGTAMIMGVQL